VGYGKKWPSAYKSSNVSETGQDRTKVTSDWTNRKFYMHFRLVPKSTTLDGREGHYALCFKTCAIVLYLFIVSFGAKNGVQKINKMIQNYKSNHKENVMNDSKICCRSLYMSLIRKNCRELKVRK